MTFVDLDPTPPEPFCVNDDDIDADLLLLLEEPELELELMLCRIDGAEAIISWGITVMLSTPRSFG